MSTFNKYTKYNNKKNNFPSTRKCHKCNMIYTPNLEYSDSNNPDLYNYCTPCIQSMLYDEDNDRIRSSPQSPVSSDEQTDITISFEYERPSYTRKKPHTVNTRDNDSRSRRSSKTSPKPNNEHIDGNDLIKLLMLFDGNRTNVIGIQPALPDAPTSNATNDTNSLISGNSSPGRPDLSDAPFEWIGNDISSIDDLIKLGKAYDRDKRIRTNLDLYQLSKLVKPLEELQDMVGMQDMKDKMFHMATYHLQGLESTKDKDHYNTCIMGDSGLGKTELATIICKFYHGIGLLKSPEPIIADKDTFEAKYLGQTTDKVRTLLDTAKKEGRAIITDEAYCILDTEGRNSFGREAIDFIVKEMGKEDGGGFIWITMGYEKDMKDRFFSANKGLPRRFPHKLYIKAPNGEELAAIFLRTCRKKGWKCNVERDMLNKIFTENRDYMPHHGGSILTFLMHCKQAHSRRLLTIQTLEELEASKKIININDIQKALETYDCNVGSIFLHIISLQKWECELNEDELNNVLNEYFENNKYLQMDTSTNDNQLDTQPNSNNMTMRNQDQIHMLIKHCKIAHVERLQKLGPLEELETTKKSISRDDIVSGIKSYKRCNGEEYKEDDHVRKYNGMYT